MKPKLLVTFFILIFISSSSEAYHFYCTYPEGSNLANWETEFHFNDLESKRNAGIACINSGGVRSGNLDWYDFLPDW